MLVMRPDWSQYATGAIVTELFELAPSPPLQRDFAKHIISAALELLVAGCKHPLTLILEETSGEVLWRLHETIYVYFHDVDDAAMDKAVDFSSFSSTIIIIVPSGYSEVLRNACKHRLLTLEEPMNSGQPTGNRRIRKKTPRLRSLAKQTSTDRRMPLIFPLDTYISMRTSFTEADHNYTRNHVVLDLFRRYNQRVIDAACDKAILVDIPPE